MKLKTNTFIYFFFVTTFVLSNNAKAELIGKEGAQQGGVKQLIAKFNKAPVGRDPSDPLSESEAKYFERSIYALNKAAKNGTYATMRCGPSPAKVGLEKNDPIFNQCGPNGTHELAGSKDPRRPKEYLEGNSALEEGNLAQSASYLPKEVELVKRAQRPSGAFTENEIENFTAAQRLAYPKPIAYSPAKEWADPQWNDMKKSSIDRQRFIDRMKFSAFYKGNNSPLDLEHPPQNPCGRTGVIGRGILGKWGPNQAADPIVTRCHLDTKTGRKVLQMIAIQRADTGDWAIPGGMVDDGDTASKTVMKELAEEALTGNPRLGETKDSPEYQKRLQENIGKVKELFRNGIKVYKGYVDDPRNTDNAWMETTAVHVHIPDEHPLSNIELHSGDDAKGAKWTPITQTMKLYASHDKLVKGARETFGKDKLVENKDDGTYSCQ